LFPTADSEKSCTLVGFSAGSGHVRNLGSILLCAIAVAASGFLLWRSQRKKAAVGRREMQILLIGYIIISLAQIFTIGGFITNHAVLVWFTAIHLGAIAATTWVLMLNAVVGYQLIDDGTPVSVGLVSFSALAFFIGTAYIAIDTGFDYTGTFAVDPTTLKNYALYVLYLLFPLLMIISFFILESVLVLRVLGEKKPMFILAGAVFFFIVGQIFEFAVSVHLCKATNGAIDGSLFETLFTLVAVVALWFFWSSITEDEWPEDPLNPTVMTESYNA
ncbi:hypothetical protein RUND412_002751, partial [Rhizina undulata]